jgi:anti-anti-sigma factor
MDALDQLLPALLEDDGADSTLIHFTTHKIVLTELNACALTNLLRRIAQLAQARRLILDFGNVTLVSAGGLGALVRAHRTMWANGRRLALCNLNDPVYEVFEATGLTSLFDIQHVALSADQDDLCILIRGEDKAK